MDSAQFAATTPRVDGDSKEGRLGDTVSLLNMKGGVGKTTLAVNLASFAYSEGRNRVLLIDLDPQFNASQYLMDFRTWERHKTTRGTIADILIESPKLQLKPRKETVPVKRRIARLRSSSTTSTYFDFLPSELALSHVVKNPAQMEYKLEKILSSVRDDYDLIFIDCAPTDSVLTTMALTASNFYLAPVRPDRFSILGFGNLQQTVAQFKDSSNDPNDVRDLGIVFTQIRGNSPIETTCMNEVRSLAKDVDAYVFNSRLEFSNTFITAIQNQTPAHETRYARYELKASVRAIYREMLKRIEALKNESDD
jgi:chromosome partitioning protein